MHDDEITTNSLYSQIISDFKGRELPSIQIESDYNNTLNYPNNYFVAPKNWNESFYTTSRKKMLMLSRGIENIVRIKPPFNKFTLVSLFQKSSNFIDVKEQYATIFPLTKALYLIGPTSLSEYSVVVNTAIIIDSTGLGLVNNWIILAIADDEGCALVAEEVKYEKYRGFFTNNLKLVITCLDILNDILGSIKKINV